MTHVSQHHYYHPVPGDALDHPEQLRDLIIDAVIGSEMHREETNWPGIPMLKTLKILVLTDCQQDNQ